MKDDYPTRLEAASMTPRKDPILHEGDDAPGPFTREQLRRYEADGYLSIEALFSQEEVALLKAGLDELRVRPSIRDAEISITERSSGDIRSIFAVETVSGLFQRLACDVRLVQAAEQLLGEGVYLHQSRVNFKPGFRGKEFYWHSDFETWHAEDGMPRMRAVSCSVALTENTEFNGSLMLIPGSHRQFISCVGRTPENHYQASLKKQEYGVPDDASLTRLVETGGIVIPKGRAGSVTFFECNTMHGSSSNISPFARSNAFFVYNSTSNALVEPFAAEKKRPWFLGNPNAVPLEAVEGRIDESALATV